MGYARRILVCKAVIDNVIRTIFMLLHMVEVSKGCFAAKGRRQHVGCTANCIKCCVLGCDLF